MQLIRKRKLNIPYNTLSVVCPRIQRVLGIQSESIELSRYTIHAIGRWVQELYQSLELRWLNVNYMQGPLVMDWSDPVRVPAATRRSVTNPAQL